MCKPSCCPGENTGSGLGIALAVLAGLALISAAARPILHAVEVIAEVALIALVALVGVALAAVVTILVIRIRAAQRRAVARPVGQLAACSAPAVGQPAPTWARAAITGRIRSLGPIPGLPPAEVETADIQRWWS